MESFSHSACFHRLRDLTWALESPEIASRLTDAEQTALRDYERAYRSLPWQVIKDHPHISELPNDDLTPLIPPGERLLELLAKREQSDMSTGRKWLLRVAWIAAVLVTLTAFMFMSFQNARKEADELISAFKTGWERESQRLQLFWSITGNHRLISWEFSYIPADGFITIPFTLQVTLTGQVVASNPRDALSKIRALKAKQAIEAAK